MSNAIRLALQPVRIVFALPGMNFCDRIGCQGGMTHETEKMVRCGAVRLDDP